jgi:hypothetical protein
VRKGWRTEVRPVLQIAALSWHSVPVTSHPRVRGAHHRYRPHSSVPGQEERDSGAGSHGEPAPKGSFPPARYYGWGKKAVPATALPCTTRATHSTQRMHEGPQHRCLGYDWKYKCTNKTRTRRQAGVGFRAILRVDKNAMRLAPLGRSNA